MPRIYEAALPIHAVSHQVGGGDLVALMGELIADTTLGADTASVDFQNIPQTFKHLLVTFVARASTAALIDTLLVRLNNDSAGNYNSVLFELAKTTNVITESLGGTSGNVSDIPANTATASRAAAGSVWLPEYATANWHKVVVAQSGYDFGDLTDQQRVPNAFVVWKSTAAVTRLTFLPGGLTNLKQNSRFTLWGLR